MCAMTATHSILAARTFVILPTDLIPYNAGFVDNAVTTNTLNHYYLNNEPKLYWHEWIKDNQKSLERTSVPFITTDYLLWLIVFRVAMLTIKKGTRRFLFPKRLTHYLVNASFAFSTNVANTTLSKTAMSAKILRSISIDAFFKPLMKRL